jgi:hypothetical protein
MKLLLISTGWFAAALVTHVFWWRIARPLAQTTALLKLFLSLYATGMLVALLSPEGALFALTPAQLFNFTVFFIPAALTYTSFYSLIEHDSPSVLIVMALDRAGSQGCTRDDLMHIFGGNELVEQRLSAAEANGLLVQDATGWVLTGKGRLFGVIFDTAARVFRFDRAG